PLWPSITYGKPIWNAKYYILDRNLELCPLRVPGDLYIGGECLAKEYMNDELLSAYKFIANPLATGEKLYRTGDVARWFEDGNMQFLGRKDQQVKIRGYRIELGEIESQLMDHPLVSGAIVLDRVDGSGNKYLCAYYVGKDKTKEEVDREELQEYLSRELPDYMLPAHFIRIEKIPLTANGKLDRRALPEPEINNENNYHYVPPENETQKKLVAIWSQVLGVDKESIGITADFFELGGHSLNATMVISRIHKEFNVKIPLAEIFNSSTIRELSQKINTPRGGEMYASVEPVEKKEYYLLSSAQKRLYFLQQMEPGNIVYNIQEAVLLEGDVDISLLAETFRRLIQRHESLRTSFEIVNNETVQRICPVGEFNIEHCEEGNSTIWRSFVRAFDLSEAPLLRVGIFRLAEKKYLLLTDMHHIISDGVSQAILKGDFEVLYSGGKLPGIRLQYKDYSEFQHSERQRQSLEKQEIFWLKELSGEIPVLDIPTDYPRPIIQSYEGNILTFDLEHDQAELLNKLGRDEKATLYMVLMAIYNVLLFKLGSSEEIIIGTPTAGRRHADLERIIGMFVNTLALKNYPTGEKTFPGLLQEVKENTIKAFENQDYPFEELVEQLLVKRDASRNPLFDVMFVLQNMEVETQKISGGAGNTGDNRGGSSVKMRPYPFTTAISRFDLTLTAVESRNGIHFTLEYCTRLFKEETVQRMIGYFKKIVSAVTIAGMSSLRLAEIEILSEAEKIRLLNEFNDTAVDYPRNKNIHQLFEEQVARNGDKIAIIDMGQQALTYLELNEQSNGLARLLMAKGMKADTIAGIMMDHSIEMMIVIFGILKSGGAYLPIDPEYPQERIDYMLKDSGAKLLVTTNDKEGEKAGKWEGEKVLLEDISQSLKNSYPLTLLPSCLLNSANLAYVIYTSGTTGKPKGVMVEHRQAINTLLCRREQYHLDRNVIALQLFSFTFDGFVTGFFTPLTAGARVIILPQEKIKNINIIRKAILKHAVTHFISVPALYGTILASAAPGDLKSLKAVTLAGDSVSTGYVEQTALEHKHIEIVVEYGVTEVTVMSTLGHHQECNPEITIGKPTGNTVIYILGKNGEFRPIGCRGELYIGGHGVSRGYLNNPELTAEKFKRNVIRHSPFVIRSSKNFPNDPCPMTNGRLYQTGDVGRWLPDG
ncbi:MAG TPA: amino acid adenylation domain-containing protein, partial [Candidatus Deferrimicrobium sp.]|nr:amino acid adenylation domain-containing protein [Candidatus Deferrimicrobium sp.]